MTMDVIIQHVEILDGSGSSPFRADVGLTGDAITDIGDLSAAVAERTIDGSGLSAAPGFIDIHSHSDFTLPINPRAESKIRQGVTTEVVGMCGNSPAPLSSASKERRSKSNPDLPWEWDTYAEYLDFLREQGTSVNVVPLVGHGTVRDMVMGPVDRPPTEDELREMKAQIARAMDEGAWGLSTGLIYAPSIYAKTEELIELSRVPAGRGGFYFSHIRGESETLLQAIGEAIEVGEEAGLPVQIAHLKASGPEYWPSLGQALALIDDARTRGVDVSADRYPYIASSTGLSASLPSWAHDGGTDALLERLRQPDARARILADPFSRSREWDRTVIAYAPHRPELEGLSVAEVAEQQDADPGTTALDILLEAEGRVSVIHYGMSEDNLRIVLRHPAVVIGSDGSARTPEGPLGEGKAHPRNYGTFPRVLAKYTRDEQVLSWPEAIRKMTGQTADRLHLPDRGYLRKGWRGDVVLFNPQTVRDTATFAEPYQFPTGIEYVFVNGQAVITPEGHTGALPGQILQHRA
jgi:N-acyl-D-amino-acid deacylase